MAKSYFLTLAGHEALLRQWLALSENDLPLDPSLHDLLGLPETCRDQKVVKDRAVKAGSALRKLEAALQRSADPASLAIFAGLQKYIASAERLICGTDSDKYLAALYAHRKRRFLTYLRRHCDATSIPAPDIRAQLLRKADDLRLPADVAGQTLDQYLQAEAVSVPEMYRDLVKWLGMRFYSEDPVWPTHFDVLGLADDQPAGNSQIQRAKTNQLAKVPDLSRHPSIDKRRAAETVCQKVECAAQELIARSTQYLDRCRKHRLTKFRAIVKEHQRLHQQLSPRAEISLVAEAASLRIPEPSAREAIGQVFPGQGQAQGKPMGGPKPQPHPQPHAAVAASGTEIQGMSFGVISAITAGLFILAFLVPWLAILVSLGGIGYCIYLFSETNDGRVLAGATACLIVGVVIPVGRYMGDSDETSAPVPAVQGESVPDGQQSQVSSPVAQPATFAVRVETTPPLASVSINGVQHGQAPVGVRLQPGSYRVEASKRGHQPELRVITVADHDQAITLQLKRSPRQTGIVKSYEHQGKLAIIDLGEIDGLSSGSRLEVELSKDEVRWKGEVLGHGQAEYSVVSVDESSCSARFESGSEVSPVAGDKVVIKRR